MDTLSPNIAPHACRPKPALGERPLLNPEQAAGLTTIFKILANETRLRILHALVRAGELRVSELADLVGMSPQAVSNQLQVLVLRGILGCRRDGLNMHYRIVDPCVIELLDHGLCLSEDAKARSR
jgi:ArsR family transcriptional regulator, lead/cadmium/zinc/bismuth-responsive transcriptional repressor